MKPNTNRVTKIWYLELIFDVIWDEIGIYTPNITISIKLPV